MMKTMRVRLGRARVAHVGAAFAAMCLAVGLTGACARTTTGTTQDSKTGLLTDVEWKNRAANELARAERSRDGFAVLFVDLDNFKRINDTHGHLVGDEVLRQVAGAIRDEVRAYDSVGRFGGDECAVLLPEIPMAAARAVAERIRDAIARLEITAVFDEQKTVVNGLSASIGVATYPEASTVEMLIRMADKAMYRAKKNGRNQVVWFTADA